MAIETTSDLSSVVSSQIVDGAVTSAKIADNAVVAAKIAAGAVGTSAISSGSATSGQILQANGSGAVTFATPAAGGGLTLIATGTPSAATSLSFGSIPGTYKHLQLIWREVYQSAQDVGWAIRLNNDSGSAYQFHLISFGGTNIDIQYQLASRTEYGALSTYAVIPSTGTTGTQYVSYGELWVYRYTESEKKLLMSRASGETSTGRQYVNSQGIYSGTSAITSIDFIRSSTQTITGTFYLYGVS